MKPPSLFNKISLLALLVKISLLLQSLKCLNDKCLVLLQFKVGQTTKNFSYQCRCRIEEHMSFEATLVNQII